MKKKTFAVVGMVISVIVVLWGILVFTGSYDYASTPSWSYDYGYASFGGDFYSYVNNNAAYAAYNVRALGSMIEKIGGIVLISLGLLSFCYFGMAEVSLSKEREMVTATQCEETAAETEMQGEVEVVETECDEDSSEER